MILNTLTKKQKDMRSSPPSTLAFLGDSVTHGVFEVDVLKPNEPTLVVDAEHVYHQVVRRKLQAVFPTVPIHIINAGVSGDNAPGGLRRLDRDVLSFAPTVTVVCFGLNDVTQGEKGLAAYTDSLQDIFKKLHKAESIPIFMTPNMTNTYVPSTISEPFLLEIAKTCALYQTNGVMDAYMQRARDICAREGVEVIDVYAKWKQLHNCGVDVVPLLANHINHPTRAMHGLFADAIVEKLLFSAL
ncbi:SGNH/GDSL hydrolase family protein [Aureibacillus halotolerans]|uniref:Lysophospholipase L1-like esterase n=1 Tax=Aureibacillus halotolerans TaxID=1508390 RepID=A0A4R6U898_9BACI|nr:GDSL-type esterase/lipase family protein [Aureibacillus halotolerans]TDQ41173.1 lysophospholipase L1-like esterase [Aureibacillus halotolerans]